MHVLLAARPCHSVPRNHEARNSAALVNQRQANGPVGESCRLASLRPRALGTGRRYKLRPAESRTARCSPLELVVSFGVVEGSEGSDSRCCLHSL
jgi:hypothetical protein